MKMRYRKTFENFTDMGRFSDVDSVDSDEQECLDKINEILYKNHGTTIQWYQQYNKFYV